MRFRARPYQPPFAVGAAGYCLVRFPKGSTFPTFTGYLTSFRAIARRPDARLLRVDVHGTMHDVTYVMARHRIHVKTIQMMSR